MNMVFLVLCIGLVPGSVQLKYDCGGGPLDIVLFNYCCGYSESDSEIKCWVFLQHRDNCNNNSHTK